MSYFSFSATGFSLGVLKKVKNNLAFLAIIFLSLFLFFFNLDRFPPSLFSDEVDVGYNAYSILKTGKDFNGNPWPIHFQSVDDWRTPLYIYFSTPFIKIFGLNAFGVRFLAALSGFLMILMVYFLGRQLWGRRLGLLAAGLLVITPWQIHYSRAAFEVTLMGFLILSGTFFFLKGLTSGKYLYLSVILMGLAPYAYNVAKLFLPFLVLALMVIFCQEIKKLPRTTLVTAILLFLMTILPIYYDSFFGQGARRFSGLNLTNSPRVVEIIDRQRGQDLDFGFPLGRVFHNKLLGYIRLFWENYADSLSARFLFVSGDFSNTRHSLPNMGLLLVSYIPGFLYGLYLAVKNWRQKSWRLVLAWLLLAPIPAGLTLNGGGHASRLFIILPALIMLIAVGYSQMLLKAPRVLTIIAAVIILGNFIFYLHQYFFHYPLSQSRWWNYGYRQAIEYAQKNEDKVDQIIISRSYEMPMIHFLFYTRYPPEKLHRLLTEGSADRKAALESIGKYRFATISQGDVYRPANTLYLAAPWDETKGWTKLDEIKNPMGDVVFIILYSGT